jgi:hypothetical protein
MIRVSTTLGGIVALAAAAALCAVSTEAAPWTSRATVPTPACRSVAVGLGLSVSEKTVSLDGFFVYGGGGSDMVGLPTLAMALGTHPGGPRTNSKPRSLHRVELLTAPNIGACARRITAVARVMQTVTRCVVRRWWRGHSGSLTNSGD